MAQRPAALGHALALMLVGWLVSTSGLVHAQTPAPLIKAPPARAAATVDDGDEYDDEEEESEPMPACQTELRLIGTLYDAQHPERSMVLFRTQPSEHGAMYRAGSTISSFAIQSVTPRGVVLRDQRGTECFLRMTHVPSAAAPAAPAQAPAKKKPRRKGK